jgi:hypothetical protein
MVAMTPERIGEIDSAVDLVLNDPAFHAAVQRLGARAATTIHGRGRWFFYDGRERWWLAYGGRRARSQIYDVLTCAGVGGSTI